MWTCTHLTRYFAKSTSFDDVPIFYIERERKQIGIDLLIAKKRLAEIF